MAAKTSSYKIGEVANLLSVQTYVLRFWETEFPQIAPLRTEKGQRLYTGKHIGILRRIQYLLHTQGMTIEGARKQLAEEKTNGFSYDFEGSPLLSSSKEKKQSNKSNLNKKDLKQSGMLPDFTDDIALNSELLEKESLLSEMESLLLEKESLLSEKELSLDDRESLLADKESSLLSRESIIAERESILLGKESVLSEREAAIKDRETALIAKESSLLSNDSFFAEKESQLLEKEKQLIEKENQLIELESSLSKQEINLSESLEFSELNEQLINKESIISENVKFFEDVKKELENISKLLTN